MSISVSQTAARAECAPKPRSFWRKLGAMLTVKRQRTHLMELDDHMLSDIGVSRSEAMEEARKTMWNVPNHWRF